MADEEEEPRCKVTYVDLPEGATEETNWIKRAGKCQGTTQQLAKHIVQTQIVQLTLSP